MPGQQIHTKKAKKLRCYFAIFSDETVVFQKLSLNILCTFCIENKLLLSQNSWSVQGSTEVS